MPLFKKKAPPLTIKLTCPWCFRKFEHNQVHFRAHISSPFPKGPDELLNTFYRDLEAGIPGEQRLALTPNVQGQQNVRSVTCGGQLANLVVSFTDQYGNESMDRLCPFCHNDLPTTLGESDTKVITVVGYTQIGKTVYILTLLEWLRKNLAQCIPGAIFNFLSREMEYEEFKPKLRELDDGTLRTNDIEYIRPLIGELVFPNKKAVILSFYDFPGDSGKDAIQKLFQRNITNADAWLILFDLTKTETFWRPVLKTKREHLKQQLEDRNLSAEKRAKLLGQLKECEEDLENCKNNDYRYRGKDEYGNAAYRDYMMADSWLTTMFMPHVSDASAPVAMIGTKSDVILSIPAELLPEPKAGISRDGYHAELKRFLLPAKEKPHGQKAISSPNSFIRNSMLPGDPNFINTVTQKLKNPCFFAVSSQGGEIGEIDRRNPIRVEDPLLWLLSRLGLHMLEG